MKKLKLATLLVIFFIVYFLISIPYYSGDVKNHLVWAKSIVTFGPMGFYERQFHDFSFPNYPPVAMLLFSLSLFLYQLTSNIIHHLNNLIQLFPSKLVYFIEDENVLIAFLKLPALLSAIILSFMSQKFLVLYHRGKSIKLATLFLLNPAVIYLTAVWGQIDLLPLAFFLPAIYFFYTKKIYLSFFCAALSLLSKQTVLVFWFAYMLLMFKERGIKSGFNGIFITLICFYLFYLPFHPFSIAWPLELYQMNFSLVANSVSENAINLWGMLFNFHSSSDTIRVWFLTLQQLGYLLFGIFYLLLLSQLIFRKIELKRFFEILFLITICYFFFLTRMHERYLIPAVVFSSFLAMVNRKYVFALIFFTIVHFLNLYRGLYMPNIPFLTQLVKETFFLNFLIIAYGITIIYYFLAFFKDR